MKNQPMQESSQNIALNQFTTIKEFLEQKTIDQLYEYLNQNNIIGIAAEKLIPLVIQHQEHDERKLNDIIRLFISYGASPNTIIGIPDPSGQNEYKKQVTLLMYSLLKNNHNLCRLLLQSGVDIKKADAQGLNSIIYYVLYSKEDQVDILQELIRLKADINSTANIEIEQGEYDCHSVFTLACLHKLKNSVQCLIDNGVNINYMTHPRKDTGLHISLIEGHLEIAILLIQTQGINPDIINDNKYRPIDIAKIKGYKEIEYLLQQKEKEEENPNINESISMYSNEIGESMYSANEDIRDNLIIMKRDQFQSNSMLNYSTMSAPKLSKEHRLSSGIITKSSQAHKIKIMHHQPNSFNLPIAFKSENTNTSNGNTYSAYFSNIYSNNTLDISNPPMLCLDLSQNTKEITAKIKELTNKITKTTSLLKTNKDYLQFTQTKLTESGEKKNKTEKMIIELQKKTEENTKLINDLNNKNALLKTQNESNNKQLSTIEKISLKFDKEDYDENYIIQLLQKDLYNYQAYNKLMIANKLLIAKQLVEIIQQIMNSIIAGYEVKIYGSYATKLCLPWSNLDIILVNKRSNRAQNIYCIQQLSQKFSLLQWVKSITLNDQTSIPCIKLETSVKYLDFKIDISIQDETHKGIECSQLVKGYLSQYDLLEPMLIGLKSILQNLNCNQFYTGGLNSYSLCLMAISFVENNNNHKFINSEMKLGALFLSFMYYYGIIFNNKTLIYPRPYFNKSVNELELLQMNMGSELMIIDPLDNMNNVAKSTKCFADIKMAFKIALMITEEICECGCHYGEEEKKNQYSNTEYCYLKKIFTAVKRYANALISPKETNYN